MSNRIALFMGILLLLGGYSASQTQNLSSSGPLQKEDGANNISTYVHTSDASIEDTDHAKLLLNKTICAAGPGGQAVCNPDDDDFYALIHVLQWSDISNDKQTVKREHWYVYHSGDWSPYDFDGRNRLYNVDHFYLLYIHLHNHEKYQYTASYQVAVTKKLPQNVANVFALLQLASTPGAASPNPYYNSWGGKKLNILHPSNITVDPRVVTITSADQDKGDELTKSQVFNNEGKYWWDVSVGIPIKKISQLKFDSVNNTVAPTQTGTQNAFALFDLYLKPVDLSSQSYSYVPHPIAGVAIGSQPLHKILVGGAIGLYYAEFYAGALFVKQQDFTALQTGSSATPQQVANASQFRFHPQFSVGINLPIRSIVNKAKPKN